MKKVQKPYSKTTRFFCDPNGPGARSSVQPVTAHMVRPGDIDVIAAIGDSLTAGNGALATNILQVFIENKGVSWSIGIVHYIYRYKNSRFFLVQMYTFHWHRINS